MAGYVTASAGAPDSEIRLSADIAPQRVAEALATFSRQTGLQLIYVSTIAETQQSKGARAGLTAAEALAQLLDGTGLAFEFLNARTVRIFPSPVTPAAVAPLPSSRHAAQQDAFALEEVTVTATRREEATNRVPIDMAVWTQDAMQASGVKGMSDLASLTPAVQFQPAAAVSGSVTYLSMRGVTGRNANTTGLYLDDTPIPPFYGDAVMNSFPFTFDLNRVEVLRGPQLQLLAEGNEGGAVRFIFNQPSLSTFTAFATSELATTRASAPSYEAGAAFGGPAIPDVLGFRISAWTRLDGGYVDLVNPFTQATVEANDNHSLSTSLRGALTLAVNEAVQITPSLTYVSYKAHDQSFFFTDLSNVRAQQLKNGSLLRQPIDLAFYLAALKVTATLGAAQLTAVSSYFERPAQFLLDATNDFNWGSPRGPGHPVSYADAVADEWAFRQRMFMQELRLTALDPSSALTWDAGAFYSSYQFRSAEHLTAANGIPGFGPVPTDIEQISVGTQTRFAAFGEVSLRMTERLTASAAVHSERTRYDAANQLSPILSAAGANSAVMPRLKLAYKADERQLVYLTIGKGYGSSGALPPFLFLGQESPAVFGIDTLWSYEIGTKSTLLDGRMQLDTGLFRIVWNNGAGYYPRPGATLGVPGAAASEGFDLAMQLLPSSHLKLGMNVSYTHARYTETITERGVVIVRQGQAISPGLDVQPVSPWNLTASVDYLTGLGCGAIADFRAEDIFRSRNPGPFAQEDPQTAYYLPGWRADPATNQLNLRASVRWQRYEAGLFVDNALNALPTISALNGTGQVTQLIVAGTFRPRTVGVHMSLRF
jgi:hypothetical protein